MAGEGETGFPAERTAWVRLESRKTYMAEKWTQLQVAISFYYCWLEFSLEPW